MGYEIIDEMFTGENPKSVFEVGCSACGLMEDFYKNGVKVGGLDIQGDDIKMKGEFFVQDASDKWPLKDNSYDIVFSVGTLIYIDKPLKALKEMLRVGKKVILAERNGHDNFEEHQLIRQKLDNDDNVIGEELLPTVYRQYLHDYERLFKKLKVKYLIREHDGKHIIKTYD